MKQELRKQVRKVACNSKEARKKESKETRKQGNKEARKQGSKKARKQESKKARENKSKQENMLLYTCYLIRAINFQV